MFPDGGMQALRGNYERNARDMSSKEIEITCPCCDMRLTVDVLTRTILKTVGPQETDEFGKPVVSEGRWDAAASKVKDRGEDAGDRLDDALAAEKKRVNRLDDLFDQAKRKLDDKSD